jgi:hypothetical protein
MPLPAPDFERLFAPGKRHELSNGSVATVRLRQDVSLWLPSGRVVAGEPFMFGAPDDSGPDFVQRVAPGEYPLVLVIADFAARGYLRAYDVIAAARLTIRDEPVVSWEMAVCAGQDVSTLGDDEFFGYPVDGGTGGFIDAENIASLCGDADYVDRVLECLDVRDSDYTATCTLTDEEGRSLVVAFSSGGGDGHYPTWVGRTADGEVACFLTDFFILTDDQDDEDGDDEPSPDGEPVPALTHFAQGNEMRAGQTLRRQSLTSPSGRYTFVHQNDDNLVLYDNEGRGAVWSSGTRGRGTGRCLLRADGDLVLYDRQARVVWSTDTAGDPGSVLVVADDGLELRTADDTVVWSVRPEPGTSAAPSALPSAALSAPLLRRTLAPTKAAPTKAAASLGRPATPMGLNSMARPAVRGTTPNPEPEADDSH